MLSVRECSLFPGAALRVGMVQRDIGYLATFIPFGLPGGSFAFHFVADLRLLAADRAFTGIVLPQRRYSLLMLHLSKTMKSTRQACIVILCQILVSPQECLHSFSHY